MWTFGTPRRTEVYTSRRWDETLMDGPITEGMICPTNTNLARIGSNPQL